MKLLTFCCMLCAFALSYAQVDFNNYQKIKSQGEIPESFKLTLEERFQKDFQVDYGLNGYDHKEYVFMKSAALDNLIQSGLVIYGDEMTNYIEDLARELLIDSKGLFDELSFYTLRSNVANAFVTGDGMVFVTMGLLSQLEEESDLAFVLSHEIAHFELKHVLNSFKRRKELEKNNIELSIDDFSAYSKKQELEADSMGLIRFLEAGYSINSVNQVFDVLMYSHLPIDEVDVSPEFLIGENNYFPEKFHLKVEKEIDFTEDYDDANSSHPNIKNRKSYTHKLYEEELSNFKGEKNFVLGKARFDQIRNIARFERVQNWIYARSYANALYEIAVLEKQYPENKHLKRWKALTWTNAAVYAVIGSNSDIFTKPSKLEGKVAHVHYFFDEMTDKDFVVYALRNVLDIKKEFPNDRMFEKMENTLLHLMILEHLDLKTFYGVTFQKAIDDFAAFSAAQDTLPGKENQSVTNQYGYSPEDWDALSKYDKIKIQRNHTNKGEVIKGVSVDSNEYLLYALTDIAKDEKYLERIERYAKELKRSEKLKDSLNGLSARQYTAYRESLNRLDLSREKLIFVEPLAIRRNFGNINYSKTLKLSKHMHEVYDEYPYKHGKQNSIVNLNKHNLARVGTEGYNARAALERYFYRFLDIDSKYYVNPDMDEFQEIAEEYNSDYFVFSLLVDDKRLTLNPTYVYISFYTLFTILPPHIAIELTKMHKVSYDVLVFDLENGNVVKQNSYSFNTRPNKITLSLYLNDILNN